MDDAALQPVTVRAVGAWAAPMRLLRMLVEPPHPSPPAVLVHAANSPASAQTLVRAEFSALDASRARIAHVSPLVACTPRLLYAHVLRQLRDIGATCVDTGAFLVRLRTLAAHGAKLVVVVHDAERMRDLWPEHVWEMLPLLAELTGLQGRLVVVFVSTLPWAAFRSISGRTISAAPVAVRLPRLARAGTCRARFPHTDAIELLRDDRSSALAAAAAWHVAAGPDGLVPMYENYCSLLYDSLRDVVRDEHQLRVLSAALWHVLMSRHQYAEPSLHGLARAMGEPTRDLLARVVPGAIGAAAWAAEQQHKEQLAPPRALPPRTGFGAMPAFLLIAAFLASYNPTKSDVKYFVRELGASRKRRRGKSQRAADAALLELEGETEMWSRPQFWGPRTFSLERMLAIYHALLADFELDLNEDGLLSAAERAARNGGQTMAHQEHVAGEFWSRSATALGQINELVAQQLIVRMSPATKLSTMQYRVNAPFEYVREVAHAVGFPLTPWLWDTHV